MSGFLMLFVRALLVCLSAVLLTAAGKVPLKNDGSAETYLSDGKQNYPVRLYGIALDWNKACRGGRVDQCMRLGDAMVVGEGDLIPDMRAAIGFYLIACDKGRALGCTTATELVREGRAYPPIPALAYQTAKKGCALGDGDSCAAVALHLYRGDAAPQDKVLAAQMWDKGCAAGASDACRLKAGALFYESSSASDQTAAIALYQTACSGKQGWGCSGLADAYSKGRGVPRDDAQAAIAARSGCFEAKGDTVLACAIHARYLSAGSNPEDNKRASMLLTTACLARVGQACNDAGLMGQRNPPGSGLARWEIARSFRDGCDFDYGAACGNLGQLYASGFDVINVDPGVAVALYDKGCRLGDTVSCDRAKAIGSSAHSQRPAIDPSLTATQQLAEATRFVQAGQGNQAFQTVGRLMEEAVADAQWMMGGWFYYGEPGVVDQVNQKDGFILFDNAARQGHVAALKWVGMAYWEGDGVAQDREKAMGYMRAAAMRDDPAAEAIYRSMQYEPERQAYARRAAEMEAAAASRKTDWGAAFSAAAARWSASASSSSSASSSASASWQRYQTRVDNSNFNNYVSYMSGGTTACISSNPYCR